MENSPEQRKEHMSRSKERSGRWYEGEDRRRHARRSSRAEEEYDTDDSPTRGDRLQSTVVSKVGGFGSLPLRNEASDPQQPRVRRRFREEAPVRPAVVEPPSEIEEGELPSGRGEEGHYGLGLSPMAVLEMEKENNLVQHHPEEEEEEERFVQMPVQTPLTFVDPPPLVDEAKPIEPINDQSSEPVAVEDPNKEEPPSQEIPLDEIPQPLMMQESVRHDDVASLETLESMQPLPTCEIPVPPDDIAAEVTTLPEEKAEEEGDKKELKRSISKSPPKHEEKRKDSRRSDDRRLTRRRSRSKSRSRSRYRSPVRRRFSRHSPVRSRYAGFRSRYSFGRRRRSSSTPDRRRRRTRSRSRDNRRRSPARGRRRSNSRSRRSRRNRRSSSSSSRSHSSRSSKKSSKSRSSSSS